jgi:hypothetical protein
MTALLVIIALLVLPALYLREIRRMRRQRGQWFADCLPLLESYRVVQHGSGFPVLTGRYRGAEIRLEPVLDDMAWRKLPSLWLKATVLVSNPRRGSLGFLVRPRGGEFYSPTAEMKERLPLPASFPRDALLCSDHRQTAPVGALEGQVRLFDDPRMKELVITPRGTRLVYQAAQAQRAEYLVLRQAKFHETRADPGQVRTLLEGALAITAAVDRETPVRAAA